MKNKVAAIVVTYNREKLLKECIERLLEAKKLYKSLSIFIIDNASTDGTADMIKKYYSNDVIYTNTGSNLGGAGGFNYGIRYVCENSDAKYLWIMDDDTMVHKDTLSSFMDKVELLKNDFSFLSSVVLWTDGKLCDMNVQSVGRKSIEEYKYIKDGLLYINSSSFVSILINVDAVKKVGLPIKEFFIYGDDFEYTKRLNTYKKGYLVSESIVTHKMGSNTGINLIEAPENRIDRYFYNYRNLLYMYKKYDKKEYRKYKLKCYYMIFKCLLKAKSKKFKRMHAICKGIRKSRNFNPIIEYIGDKK